MEKRSQSLGWGDIGDMMKDPDFRRRNPHLIQEALSLPGPERARNAQRGRANRRAGEAFEEEIVYVLSRLWGAGEGMVFNTGPAVKHVGKGEIVYKPQPKSDLHPPLNPPDFMGSLFGIPVAFDAKVSRSSTTYYATRDKKKKQHEGIVSLAREFGLDALVGYLVEWNSEKISFIHALDVEDGKVRQRLQTYEADTVEGVLRQWATDKGKSFPL